MKFLADYIDLADGVSAYLRNPARRIRKDFERERNRSVEERLVRRYDE